MKEENVINIMDEWEKTIDEEQKNKYKFPLKLTYKEDLNINIEDENLNIKLPIYNDNYIKINTVSINKNKKGIKKLNSLF